MTKKQTDFGNEDRLFYQKILDTVLKWAYSANSWEIRASKCQVASAVSFDSGVLHWVSSFSHTNFALDGICPTCRDKVCVEICVIPLTPTKKRDEVELASKKWK